MSDPDTAAAAAEEEEEAGDEFSEDEFDPVEFDYENIRRPSPEGAEDKTDRRPAYDRLTELNESFGEEELPTAAVGGDGRAANNSYGNCSFNSNSTR